MDFGFLFVQQEQENRVFSAGLGHGFRQNDLGHKPPAIVLKR